MPTTDPGGGPTPERPGRRTFGPVVLAGLAGSGLATLGATKPWFVPAQVSEVPVGSMVAESGGQVPLAVSLGLVCLASWGALLVSRGVLRRVLAVLGALAAAGLLAAWVWGWWSVPAALEEDLRGFGVTGAEVSPQWWYWLSGVGGLVALLAAGAAVRLEGEWPEMGRRYDAPTGPATTPDPTGPDPETTGRDLWRALDEGRDPTSHGE